MSTVGSNSLPRTYGKRSAMKRKFIKDPTERKDLPPRAATPLKRRRLSPEPSTQTPSPSRTEETAVSEPEQRDSLPKPRSNRTESPSPADSSSKASKPIRDLSAIFDDILPAKSLAVSPSKGAKRMLSRSKTDTSIGSQPMKNQDVPFERTPSLPNIPSSPSGRPTSVPSKSTPVLPMLPPNKKSFSRTYAGNFRSFLVSLPASGSQDPLDPGDFDARESYSSLRTRWGIDNSEDDPYPVLSPSPTKSNISSPSPSRTRKGKGKDVLIPVRPLDYNALKSISELRNKGESRRFLDEVGYLFEGMDKQGGISLRRASALEIATKLCDTEFTRKAKAADFFVKTWDLFIDAGAGKGEDKILDLLFLFFITLVARDSLSLIELAERSSPSETHPDAGSFVDFIFRLLEAFPLESDPLVAAANPQSGDAGLKKVGISKKDRITLITIYKTISTKPGLFSSDTLITVSMLVGYILQSLTTSMIPVSRFPAFLKSFRDNFSSRPSVTLESSLSLHWAETASSISYESIFYYLQLLDAYLLDQWDSSALDEGDLRDNDIKAELEDALAHARDNWLADDLVSLGVCIELSSKNGEPEFAQRCLSVMLRILVSLTHINEPWGRKIAQCEYTMGWLMRLVHRTALSMQQISTMSGGKEEKAFKVEDPDDILSDDQGSPRQDGGDSMALDTLCLALGLLTNLVQDAPEAKDFLRDIRLNPICPLKRRICGRKCACSGVISGIEVLTQLYTQQDIKVESTTGLLTEDLHDAHAEADASFLRGHLAVLFGLLMVNCPQNHSPVISALPFSSTVKKNLKEINRIKLTKLVEHAKDFLVFYTAVSNKLGGQEDSKVAREVVVFLENQRDNCV